MSKIGKIGAIILVLFVGSQIVFFALEKIFPSPEDKIEFPETIDTDLTQEEIEEMQEMIDEFEKGVCSYLVAKDKKKLEKEFEKIWFPEEIKEWIAINGADEKLDFCKVELKTLEDPKRFKDLLDRTEFTVVTLSSYPGSTDTEDHIIYFFKKDTNDKWKIEKRESLINPNDVYWMVEDIIQELQEKDAKGE